MDEFLYGATSTFILNGGLYSIGLGEEENSTTFEILFEIGTIIQKY